LKVANRGRVRITTWPRLLLIHPSAAISDDGHDDGGFEMAIFSGPRAHERAIIFAERCYGSYEQVRSNQG
jgi:hypothetical protein